MKAETANTAAPKGRTSFKGLLLRSGVTGVRDGWWKSNQVKSSISLKWTETGKKRYASSLGDKVEFIRFITLRNMANCPTVLIKTR